MPARRSLLCQLYGSEIRLDQQAVVVERALKRVYYAAQQRYETASLVARPLTSRHPNVAFGDSTRAGRFVLRVPRRSEQVVREMVQAVVEGKDNPRLVQALPRLWCEAHLFQPLLVGGHNGENLEVRPTGLVASEATFLRELETWWAHAHTTPVWEGLELFVLRNLPRSGVGFYENAGFYPDFLVWMVRGEQQMLGFVDPKGLVHWNGDKVAMLATIEALSLPMLPLRAVIATDTAYEDIGSATRGFRRPSRPTLESQGVVLGGPGRIESIMRRFVSALP